MRAEPSPTALSIPWRLIDCILLALSTAWFLVALIPLSDVLVDFDWLLLLLFTFCLLALLWVARAAPFAVGLRTKRPSLLSWMSVGALPLLFVTAVTLSDSEALLRARLALSDGDLERYAREFEARGAHYEEGRQVGLFRVDYVTKSPDGCVRMVTAHGFFTTAGLAHCQPDDGPLPTSLTTFRHISGDWWAWEQRFE